MPLPEIIQWYRSTDGAALFSLPPGDHIGVTYFGAGERRVVTQGVSGLVSIPLVECHREILDRRQAGGLIPADAGYLIQRSAFIQERLIELYVMAIRAGIQDTGHFYGVIREQGEFQVLAPIRFEGAVLEFLNGESVRYHQIGLIYSPVVLNWDRDPAVGRVLDIELQELELPTVVLRTYRNHNHNLQMNHQALVGPTELHSAMAVLDSEDSIDGDEPARVSRYERDPVI